MHFPVKYVNIWKLGKASKNGAHVLVEKTGGILMSNNIKILIADDSVEGTLTYSAALAGQGFLVLNREKDGRILLEKIKSEAPDIVVTDAFLPGINAEEVIRTIRSSVYKCPAFLVIIPENDPVYANKLKAAGATAVMPKPIDSRSYVEAVAELVKQTGKPVIYSSDDDEDMEIIVTDVIHQVGVPAHIKGYQYLRDAIILCVFNPDMLEGVTKILYPTVARRFSTTPSRVERAIRHAIEIAWDRGDVDTLNSFFGYTVNTGKGKPTNSEFIALITDKLRLKYKKFIGEQNGTFASRA